jgi:hypothetical protein
MYFAQIPKRRIQDDIGASAIGDYPQTCEKNLLTALERLPTFFFPELHKS